MYRDGFKPTFMSYFDFKDPEIRTCRVWREDSCAVKHPLYYPSGVVDLCPCTKLTMGKKRQIVNRLLENARMDNKVRPAADFWWHMCRHVYNDIELKLQIGLFLYDGTENYWDKRKIAVGSHILHMPPTKGDLGALLEYRLTFPSKSETKSPRLLCPHLNLVESIRRLLECRDEHRLRGSVCRLCCDIQYCPQCRTKVLNLRKTENDYDDMISCPRKNRNINTNMISCSFQVERCLDGNLWPMHTVFPFARRQVPLQRDSPCPLKRGEWTMSVKALL
jgi:hypothetical protein